MTETAELPAEIDPDQILHFSGGIPGFPGCERFVLMDLAAESAFSLFQCLDDPGVSMIVGVPWLFFPDYSLELSEMEQRELGLEGEEDAVVFCPVTLDATENRVYVNLLGPFVVNAKTREGRQVVLTDANLPLRAVVDLA